MYDLLIKNCGQVVTMQGSAPKCGKEMRELGVVEDGFVACEGEKIVEVGKMADFERRCDFFEKQIGKKTKVIDAGGGVLLPGLIDCHTHLVFAGNRAGEWREKLLGKSYLEILAAGGGILSTVKATRAASKKELLDNGLGHLREMLGYGVTTVEIKSGYGLDSENELKILEVAGELGRIQPISVVRTFLGAHVVGPEFRGDASNGDNGADEYLKYLIEKVLPKVKGKADFVDIFCEKGAFDLKQSKKYLEAAKKMGFGVKIHAEQINNLGGCKMACALGAASFDHGDHLTGADIKAVAKSKSVAVVLPLVPLFLRENVFADGRAMIDNGLAVAVSTDFNPGSCPSKNIFLAMSMACIKMGLLPEEALAAVTVNAAAALKLFDRGVIAKGKRADLVLFDVKNYQEIPYWMGDSKVSRVVCGGKL